MSLHLRNLVEDDTSQKPTPDLHEDDPPVDYGEMDEGEGGNCNILPLSLVL